MITLWQAKAQAEKDLLKLHGISGISIGNSKIIVYVETERDIEKVPETIAGYETEPIVVGRICTLDSLPKAKHGWIRGMRIDKRARTRPAPGGVSVGHYLITAGTLSTRVYDKATGRRLFLSNNHVIAASNKGEIGDPILQPGRFDGGTDPEDRIGTLLRFVEIKLPPEMNLVDAAVGVPVRDEDLSDEVLDVGVITDIEEARVGMKVAKSGRSTCYMEGVVSDVNATVKVYFYPWGFSLFEDQIITTTIGAPGDSGSICINTETKKAVGLLFAGSPLITVSNKITHVCRLLDIDFKTPGVRLMGMPMFLALTLFPTAYYWWKERKF